MGGARRGGAIEVELGGAGLGGRAREWGSEGAEFVEGKLGGKSAAGAVVDRGTDSGKQEGCGEGRWRPAGSSSILAQGREILC